MPADLPAAAPAVTFPYYRLISFVAGGSLTLVIFIFVTTLLRRASGQ